MNKSRMSSHNNSGMVSEMSFDTLQIARELKTMSEEQKRQLIQKDINLSKNEKKMKEYMKKMPDMSFTKLDSVLGRKMPDSKSNYQGQSEDFEIEDTDREMKRNIA